MSAISSSARSIPQIHRRNPSRDGYGSSQQYANAPQLARYPTNDDTASLYADSVSVHSRTGLTINTARDLGPLPGAPSYPPRPSPLLPPSPFQANFQNGGNHEKGVNLTSRRYEGGYNSEYNAARQKLMNRRSVRQIELTDGHLVLDCPVPRSILQYSKYQGEDLSEESGKMRYTAVTVDPDDFTRSRYTLRQSMYGRKTELFLCLTMYNEDEELFCRTFTSVIKNIQHLQSREKSKTWGKGSWKKVVVCIVSDGRHKINERTLKIIGLYGAFQDGIAKDTIAEKEVQAHLFEYTSQVLVDASGNVTNGLAPIQILFCLKEQNKKKLNSHRWAFNAFCPQLQPNVCILIDVGTKPSGTSIYSLWKAFDRSKKVGGACGEITVDLGRSCSNLLNPLVAAQNFEYKMSNILDKSLESVFGYISVLPGAFSAYRYKALLNGPDGEGPLATYFLGEKMHEDGGVGASLADSNMYLAEDRILCFEIVCKRREAWTLKYVKAAKASTDVPDSVPEFISQRRRWMNGSFFAALHSNLHYYRLWTSGQGFFRKLWLSILFFYSSVQLIFSFVGISSFYLAFFFLTNSAISDSSRPAFGSVGDDVVSITQSAFIATIGVTIVCALGNKPQGSKWWYVAVMTVFGILFCLAMYCTIWTIYLAVPHSAEEWSNIGALLERSAFRDIVIALGSTYGLYVFSSLLHAEPAHLFTCMIQYLLFLPSYVIVLTIYAFANLHDLAWGTKGDTSVKDLGHANKTKTADGKELVNIDVPTLPDDIDALWLHMRKEMTVKQAQKRKKRDASTKKADQYSNIRTNTLLTYLGFNMIIVMFFTSTIWTSFVATNSGSEVTVNYYMVGIFWAVAVLSAFRFIGSTLYLLLNALGL